MNKKWKVAFFVSLAINVLLVAGTGYIVLINTLASGHNYDNLITIKEDLNNISTAIQNGAHTIDEFDKELKEANAGHWTDKDKNFITLQIVHLLFDDNDNFTKIETYYLDNKIEE